MAEKDPLSWLPMSPLEGPPLPRALANRVDWFFGEPKKLISKGILNDEDEEIISRIVENWGMRKVEAFIKALKEELRHL